MILKKTFPFLRASDLGAETTTFKILEVNLVKNQWEKEQPELIMLSSYGTVKWSPFSYHRNKLIEKFGEDTDGWIMKDIRLGTEDVIKEGKLEKRLFLNF